jgi:aspartyl protease family protein
MSDSGGPWQRQSERAPEPGSPWPRFVALAALVVIGALGIAYLTRLFPGAIAEPADNAYFLQGCVLAAVIGSGIVSSRHFRWGEGLRHLATWVAIAAVLVFAYVGYHRYHDAALDAGSELVPGYPVSLGAGEMVLTQNGDGDFEVFGRVNGAPVRFMVDTGASDIVLAPKDAQRAGIDVKQLRFTRGYETANGEGRGAAVTLDSLDIGEMRLAGVAATVNGAEMHSSLLGMAFLKRMKSFEMKGRKLYLRWR